MTNESPELDHLYSYKELKEKNIAPQSYSTLMQQVEQGRFPAPMRFPSGRLAWKESVISTYMEAVSNA